MSFQIKRGDTLPSVEATLSDQDGAVSLTGATVEMSLYRRPTDPKGTGVLVFTKAAVVVNASTGAVRYDWSAGDTDIAGNYYVEFIMTVVATGKKMTFPSSGFVPVTINPDLS
jgi:hypothetical protein